MLGSLPLAAVALGGGVYFTGVVICLGVLTAVARLSAYAIGAGDRDSAGRIAASGLILAALIGLLLIGVTALAPLLLDTLGYDLGVGARDRPFSARGTPGAPSFLGFVVLRKFSARREGRTRGVMIVLLLCVPAKCRAFNWVLIFGNPRACRRLGLVGAGDSPWPACSG